MSAPLPLAWLSLAGSSHCSTLLMSEALVLLTVSALRAAKAAAKADKERSAAEAKAEKKRIADEKAR